MNGVSKITTAEDVVLISFPDASPAFMSQTLTRLADAGVVLDMISQAAPSGNTIRFSFTTSQAFLDAAIRAVVNGRSPQNASPMISSGYSKINLFGEEMVESIGVAAKAIEVLTNEDVEVFLITTSDLDISLLVRREDADVALAALRRVYAIN